MSECRKCKKILNDGTSICNKCYCGYDNIAGSRSLGHLKIPFKEIAKDIEFYCRKASDILIKTNFSEGKYDDVFIDEIGETSMVPPVRAQRFSISAGTVFKLEIIWCRQYGYVKWVLYYE
jgi:hypothetical protein